MTAFDKLMAFLEAPGIHILQILSDLTWFLELSCALVAALPTAPRVHALARPHAVFLCGSTVLWQV